MSDRITRRGELILRHTKLDALTAPAVANGAAQIAAATGAGAMMPAVPFAQERIIYRGIDDTTGDFLFVREIFDENTGAVTYEYSNVANFSTLVTPASTVSPVNVAGTTKLNLLEGDEEVLSVDDSGTVALTVPASAIGALVQVEILSGDGCVRLYADGQTPTDTDGIKATHLAQISLGISPVANGDSMELGNFLAIAETGTTATIRVEYYEEA